MGPKSFLLTIEDEDLYLMLEDLEWSYLKEIFNDIRPWSESINYRERATWLEVKGLPLHVWNAVTLKKIAKLWGSFDAMGVNANHSRDCEKVTVLISTDQVKEIEEVFEIEVGDKIFEIGVVELGFSDDTATALGKKVIADKVNCDVIQESESETDTISLQDKEEVVDDDRSCSGTEEEALNVMCAEKDLINCLNREMESLRDQINKEELMVGNSKVEKKTTKFVDSEEADKKRDCKLVHDENVVDINVGGSIWVGEVSKGLLNDNGLVEHVADPNEISTQFCEPLSGMAIKNDRNMGFKYTRVGIGSKFQSGCSTLAVVGIFLELDRASSLIGMLCFNHVDQLDIPMAAMLAKEGAHRVDF
ncbi:hypothetical protein V6N13_069451 [Hibiscus sabdariffa]